MSFASESVIFAVPAASMANVAEAREKYGELLPLRPLDPDTDEVKTLLGHIDRAGSTTLRAGILGQTVTGRTLTNGMVAFSGHFVDAFLDALGADPLLDGCLLLTEEEFQELLPQ